MFYRRNKTGLLIYTEPGVCELIGAVGHQFKRLMIATHPGPHVSLITLRRQQFLLRCNYICQILHRDL